MTAINFPNPAGQTPVNTFGPDTTPAATANGVTYEYTNGSWSIVGAGGSSTEDRFVSKIADDHKIGELTIGPDAGTDNITLAADGNVGLFNKSTKGYGLDFSYQGNINDGYSPYIRVQRLPGTTSDKPGNAFIRSYNDTTLTTNLTYNGLLDLGGAIDKDDPNASVANIRLDGRDGSAVFRDSVGLANNRFYVEHLSGQGSRLYLGTSNVVSNSASRTVEIDGRDGSATFAGGVTASDRFRCTRTDGTSACLVAYTEGGSTSTARINANGSASFEGLVTFNGGTSGVTGRALEVNGEISIGTETDNPANYTTTTDAEGNETQVYNGPTLDVKDRLTKADNALKLLKTAAAAATDFAGLQAAIATALADV